MSVPRIIPFLAPVLMALALLACSGPTAAPTSGSLVPQAPAANVSSPISATQPTTGALGAPLGVTPALTVTAAVTATAALTTPAAMTATEAAAEVPSQTEPISAITKTLTYEDKDIGYAIDYPASWSIDATAGSMVLLTSADLEAQTGGVPPGAARVNIVPDLPQVTTTLAELVAQGQQTGEVTAQEDVQLSGGVPAVLFYVNSPALGGNIRLLVTVINGRGIRVQGYGDLSLFDAIARSLRPLAAPTP